MRHRRLPDAWNQPSSEETGEVNELVRLSGSRLFALRMQAARLLASRLLWLAVLARLELYLRLHVAIALARLPLAPVVMPRPAAGGDC